MQEDAERWLPLPEAARELGVSVDTVRRRLKRGELRGERRSIPQGFVWWVCLDSSAVQAEVGSTPRRAILAEVSELGKLVRELQAENRNLAGQIGFYQAQHQQMQEKILMLEAPKAPESAPEGQEVALVQEEGNRADSIPWWRLWWRRLVTG
jgi:hypothetical protein